MAESGQQPTVDATLVNDIFEMLMEMDIRKIDIRLQRQYFDRLLHDLRNLQPPEVSVVRLRKFMSLLQKTVQNHSNAQRVESTVWTLRMPVFVLFEGTQRQNVRQSAILD